MVVDFADMFWDPVDDLLPNATSWAIFFFESLQEDNQQYSP